MKTMFTLKKTYNNEKNPHTILIAVTQILLTDRFNNWFTVYVIRSPHKCLSCQKQSELKFDTLVHI